VPLTANRLRALAHIGQAKALLSNMFRWLLHTASIVGYAQFQCVIVSNQGNRYVARMSMAHGVAEGLLRDAQKLMLVLWRQARVATAALKDAAQPIGYRRALRQLSQGQLQSASARLSGL
jgi:hypothetical protein